MRNRRVVAGLTVNAIAGTHVVLLGFDLSGAARPGCLGFAIQRTDHTEGETYWMRGSKTFKETDLGLAPGGSVSSRQHPFQTFQWADYSAKPAHDYTYSVMPLYDTPAALREGQQVDVRVSTENETGATHSIWFNRGAIASQEYARRFANKPPDVIANGAAYTWLSRGLLEALLSFISRATDASYGVVGAVYEFQWPAVLQALKDAAGRGASVDIVYDAIPSSTGPVALNEAAIKSVGIEALCQRRTAGKLMHNKFLILAHNGSPVAVWTGSTNLTENGIFGHSNLGHLVEDATIAGAYYAYWKALKLDPTTAQQKLWTASNNPVPPNPLDQPTTPVFSPHKGYGVLDWYAETARTTRAPDPTQLPLMMTFAFGMDTRFKAIYEQPDGVLRIALMEKEGNGSGLKQGKIDIARIRKLDNVIVAIGNSIALNGFDRWLGERAQLSKDANVRYVHTKYMLVDPLGPNPIVVTGSANFSQASTDTNDENMLVIRDDTRVADIYIGEFMRLYSHYAFRETVKRALEQDVSLDQWQPRNLISDDTWQHDYFTAGSSRRLRRVYFAGT